MITGFRSSAKSSRGRGRGSSKRSWWARATCPKLEAVARACRREPIHGDDEPLTPGAVLVSLGDESKPMKWQIGGLDWDDPPVAHLAHVSIMSMRKAVSRRLEAAVTERVRGRKRPAARKGTKR